jgi:osmotically-inducible protein OsmY
MTDREVEQAVLSALYSEPFIDAGRIVVRVCVGVVTLTGEVDTHSQKLAAKQQAEHARGVREVVDELAVSAAAKVEGAGDEIAAGVLNALYWDLAVPPDRVSARCEKGWVTLSGEVERPYQKSCAEADVRKVRGVIGVTNEIRVGASDAARVDALARGGAIALDQSIGAIAGDRQMGARRQAPLS